MSRPQAKIDVAFPKPVLVDARADVATLHGTPRWSSRRVLLRAAALDAFDASLMSEVNIAVLNDNITRFTGSPAPPATTADTREASGGARSG